MPRNIQLTPKNTRGFFIWYTSIINCHVHREVMLNECPVGQDCRTYRLGRRRPNRSILKFTKGSVFKMKKRLKKTVSIALVLCCLVSLLSVNSLAATYNNGAKQIIINRSGNVYTVTAADGQSQFSSKSAIFEAGMVYYKQNNLILLIKASTVNSSTAHAVTNRIDCTLSGNSIDFSRTKVYGRGTVAGWSILDLFN